MTILGHFLNPENKWMNISNHKSMLDTEIIKMRKLQMSVKIPHQITDIILKNNLWYSFKLYKSTLLKNFTY